jgi:PAS domain S-box-containing protein
VHPAGVVAPAVPDHRITGLVRRLNEARDANRELRAALSALDQRYGLAADCYEFAPVGCCGTDVIGRVIDINGSGAALLGKSRSAILGLPLADLVVATDRNRVREHLKRCMSAPLVGSTYARVVDAGGTEHWVQMVSKPFPSPSVEGLVLVTSLLEVSEPPEVIGGRAETRFMIDRRW